MIVKGTGNMIVILYDLFSRNSQVWVYQDDSQQQTIIDSNLSEFAKNINSLVDITNIFSVKLSAPFKVVKEIKQQLAEINEKIELEGI